MSASLVGSEMCIRDSSPHLRTREALPPEEALRDGRGAGARGPEDRRGPCLLYTSDAADDM
eukprot:9822975-Alexandrium_andersonii.AAC.1